MMKAPFGLYNMVIVQTIHHPDWVYPNLREGLDMVRLARKNLDSLEDPEVSQLIPHPYK